MSFSCCRKSGIKLSGSAAEGLITSYSLQILHNTSRALDLEARLARLEERSRHVQINDESLCDSCHARLGTKLFAMYPDDTIVCYKVGNMPLLLPLQVYIYICFPWIENYHESISCFSHLVKGWYFSIVLAQVSDAVANRLKLIN